MTGHVPVLLAEVVAALAPIDGAVIVDGTFGAGGYTRALLDGGARVLAIDRDARAIAAGADLAARHPGRLTLAHGLFGALDTLAADAGLGPVSGVVLDIGVSSMQLDQADRGFSFLRDGPLDMRMGGEGPDAAALVNGADEGVLADILHQFGEERLARRIARAIVAARPLTRTAELAELVGRVLPRPRPGQIHPATRTFQALRIAVNDELGQLVAALGAAERLLAPGGRLAVVTFHSLEDRIVKRYLTEASGLGAAGSRHAPARRQDPARYDRPAKPVTASEAEIARNPRARSARLRAALRGAAPARPLAPADLGLPAIADTAAAWGAP